MSSWPCDLWPAKRGRDAGTTERNHHVGKNLPRHYRIRKALHANARNRKGSRYRCLECGGGATSLSRRVELRSKPFSRRSHPPNLVPLDASDVEGKLVDYF